MRSKPFSVLLATLLMVALAFSAVGCGGGKGVEGLPAAAQPHEAAAPDSSVSDRQGDVPELRILSPAPDLGRDVTIQGNTAKLLVPRWVVGYPQSIQWVGGTVSLEQWTALDVAPDFKALDWARGATSEAPDAQNPEFQPHEDLTYVRLREVADSRLEFFWRCRGDIPLDAPDAGYGAFIAQSLVIGPDYAVAIAPASAVPLAPPDAGWVWLVAALSEAGFPWDTAGYEDILSAGVSQSGDGQLTFEMTTAQDIPAVPAEADGNPIFSWVLDQGGDGTVGAQFDLGVVVRWKAEPGQWEGAVMSWDGQDYIDLDIPVAMTRSDATVSATVDAADLGLEGPFYWAAMAAVQVGPEEEQFLGLADQAPDSGWVEETLAPTPRRIYLPVICRNVAI
jgi:hypothetical protein